MKKKYKIILAIALTIVCVCSGCGNAAGSENEKESTEAVITTEDTEKITEDETTEEVTTEAKITQTQESSSSNEAEGGELSAEWRDMQFQFDGKSYDIPFSYKDLEAAGWSFDLAEYGYDNGYVLNPGDKISSTIHLEKDSYDSHEVYVTIGFINNDDTAKDILDCDIWSFSLDVETGFTLADSYPDMKIAKGIGIGSSREEVEAAFGEAEDVSEDTENNYVYLEYSLDFTYYLRFRIGEDYGVTSIEMQEY